MALITTAHQNDAVPHALNRLAIESAIQTMQQHVQGQQIRDACCGRCSMRFGLIMITVSLRVCLSFVFHSVTRVSSCLLVEPGVQPRVHLQYASAVDHLCELQFCLVTGILFKPFVSDPRPLQEHHVNGTFFVCTQLCLWVIADYAQP